MDAFYSDDVCQVYHNDFRKLIDTLEFDFIVTDPPYNVGYAYPDYDDNMCSIDYIKMLNKLKPHKTIMVHYAEDFCGDVRDAMGKPDRCVSWCYSSNLRRQSRMIAWFGCKPDFNKVKQPYKDEKDKRNIENRKKGSTGARIYDWWSDIQLVKNVSKCKVKTFTNQMPVALLERIILITTKPGDTILDPFFGSGSLYFACKNTGRKCIGIEQSDAHLKSFKERLQIEGIEGNPDNTILI